MTKKFFYANSVQLGVSAYDFTLHFLRQGMPPGSPDAKGVVPPNQDDLAVGMSASHAKAMLAGLYDAVVQYEKAFGPIPLDPKVKAAYDEFVKRVKS